jgi:hypothetical protein
MSAKQWSHSYIFSHTGRRTSRGVIVAILPQL